MIAGVLGVLLVVALLASVLATVRNDGYGQRPPPARLEADASHR